MIPTRDTAHLQARGSSSVYLSWWALCLKGNIGRFHPILEFPSKRKGGRDQGPPDDPGHPTVDFSNEVRSNDSHESTTDPEARLAKQGAGKDDCALALSKRDGHPAGEPCAHCRPHGRFPAHKRLAHNDWTAYRHCRPHGRCPCRWPAATRPDLRPLPAERLALPAAWPVPRAPRPRCALHGSVGRNLPFAAMP